MLGNRITDYSGKTVGWVETLDNGDQQVSAFSGKIIAFYRASNNTTTDFYGRIISHGNVAVGMLYNPQYNDEYKP